MCEWRRWDAKRKTVALFSSSFLYFLIPTKSLRLFAHQHGFSICGFLRSFTFFVQPITFYDKVLRAHETATIATNWNRTGKILQECCGEKVFNEVDKIMGDENLDSVFGVPVDGINDVYYSALCQERVRESKKKKTLNEPCINRFFWSISWLGKSNGHVDLQWRGIRETRWQRRR